MTWPVTWSAALFYSYEALEDLQAGRPYMTGGRDYKGPHPLSGLHQARDGWILAAAAPPYGETHASAERYLRRDVSAAATHEAISRLESDGVPAVPCLGSEELLEEPHLNDNDL